MDIPVTDSSPLARRQLNYSWRRYRWRC